MKRQLRGGGIAVRRGRTIYYPFSPRALTPEDRAAGIQSLNDLDDAALARRIAHRAAERRAMGGICQECGGSMPNLHQPGCPSRNTL